jgi:signal transduction histidine kinase
MKPREMKSLMGEASHATMAPMDPSARASARGLAALAALGLAAGLVVAWLTLASDHLDEPGVDAVLALLVGWSFIGTGLFAWWRRPGNRTGLLMVAIGFAWFATSLSASDDDLLFTIGIALDGLFLAMLGHLLIAFPSGRLETRAERLVVLAIYCVATVLQVPGLLFEESGDPSNLMMVEPDQGLSDLLDGLQYLAAVVITAVGFVVILRRRAAVPAARRPVLSPVLWTGGATLVASVVAQGFDAVGSPEPWLERLALLLFATVPFGFLAGLLRTRLAHGAAVSDLVARLGDAPGEEELRGALAEGLGDPDVQLAYWLPASERFVDAAGHPFALPDRGWTAVELQGRRVAAIVHDPALDEEPDLTRTAGAAAALALENQRLSAELRARIEDLRASRTRLVEAGDAERRRLERDLHDGAQSRLVALALKLQQARRRADGLPELATILDESSSELKASLDELRELARGIHPAELTDRGLRPALETLTSRAPVPVELSGDAGELPPALATAVYFVVSEALTNVAKYAGAERAAVTLARFPGRVTVTISDDGVGGADPDAGSGLRGLLDRVAALDGELRLDSPPGAGTRVEAAFPLGGAA